MSKRSANLRDWRRARDASALAADGAGAAPPR